MATGPTSKIIELGLEHVVIQARNEGKGLDQIVTACNDELCRREVVGGGSHAPETVSKSTVKRYLAQLAPGTVAAAHEPTVAVENARVAIEFAERLGALDKTVRRWLDEADQAVVPMRGVLWNPYRQEPTDAKTARDEAGEQLDGLADLEFLAPDALKNITEWIKPVEVLVVDWHARKVAASELRGLLKVFADLMQRVHDAEEVRAFQEAFTETIREVDPAAAAMMIKKLREKRSVRNAAILG